MYICGRSPDVLLPGNGADVAATPARVLGLSHPSGVTCALLPPSAPPPDFDTRSSIGGRWVANSNTTAGRVPRMANLHGELTPRHMRIPLTYIHVNKYLIFN